MAVTVTGVRLLTVNVCGAEVPPPGAGVTTVIESVAAVVRSAVGMTAVNCVALRESGRQRRAIEVNRRAVDEACSGQGDGRVRGGADRTAVGLMFVERRYPD